MVRRHREWFHDHLPFWERGFLRGFFSDAESDIAIEYGGEEAIHEVAWRELPEGERELWEPITEPAYESLYRRKRW